MDVATIFTSIIAVMGISFILYKVRFLNRYRREEIAAREYFDRNGHFPDEDAASAASERGEMAGEYSRYLAGLEDGSSFAPRNRPRRRR